MPSRPGRPPLAAGQPTDVVHVRLPAYLHDAAREIASYEAVSVVAVIRKAVTVYAACNSVTANSPYFVSKNPTDE